MTMQTDFLLQGSTTFCVPDRWEANLPLLKQLVSFARLDGNVPPSVEMDYCTVRRKQGERQTCHACEGGHHVHVVWASEAAPATISALQLNTSSSRMTTKREATEHE